MGTKNRPGDYDCYMAADPDEPMFHLLGRDRHAPAIVRLWALLRHRDGEDLAKVAEALACADAMEAWADQLGKPPLEARRSASNISMLMVCATAGLLDHPPGYRGSCICAKCKG